MTLCLHGQLPSSLAIAAGLNSLRSLALHPFEGKY
jgi:hypothetical protein